MNLIEKIASTLSLVGIPMGRFDPCNLIVAASRSFIQADELAEHGIDIPGRVMSTAEFRAAAQEYVGFDPVTEVLDEEVYSGVNILEHCRLLARRLVESKDDNPEFFHESLDQIAGNIARAQNKLLR